ncbi:DUF7660 family protein (plasmid) [Streptomyces sp. HUAS TT11]|uniref:DUF7660 family protein n=1 Tax=Streptomyces sp. HUAS TT11 TaxID=3447508 RepID=UPI003F658BFA
MTGETSASPSHWSLTSADQWENRTLDSFLEALEVWVADTPGWYANHGQELPPEGDWASWRGPSAQRGSTSDAVPLACPMKEAANGNSGESRQTVREPAGERYARSGRSRVLGRSPGRCQAVGE